MHDLVGHRAGLDVTRPVNHGRHAPGAFPIGVLLAAERRRPGIWPGVLVGAVIDGVEHEGVAGDAEIIELFQEHADRV